jgi:hypothetical protein
MGGEREGFRDCGACQVSEDWWEGINKMQKCHEHISALEKELRKISTGLKRETEMKKSKLRYTTNATPATPSPTIQTPNPASPNKSSTPFSLPNFTEILAPPQGGFTGEIRTGPTRAIYTGSRKIYAPVTPHERRRWGRMMPVSPPLERRQWSPWPLVPEEEGDGDVHWSTEKPEPEENGDGEAAAEDGGECEREDEEVVEKVDNWTRVAHLGKRRASPSFGDERRVRGLGGENHIAISARFALNASRK